MSSLQIRGLTILLVIVVAILIAFPLDEKINLGLDLRGGMHLVLEVETQDAVRAETETQAELLIQRLKEEEEIEASFELTSDSSFELTGVPADRADAVRDAARRALGDQNWDWRQSGDRWLFDLKAQALAELRNQAVGQAVETIRNRVDAFGVTEPAILRTGNRIVVQLPGVDDPERVKSLIKNTAFLELRLVAEQAPNPAPTRAALIEQLGGRIPDDVEILPQDIEDANGNVIGQRFWAVEKRRVITGRDLRNARPSTGRLGDPVVLFILNREGGRKFGEVTGANVGRLLATILDGKVIIAPRINSRITDEGIIEGGFTPQEVNDLALVLRSGALPAGITYLEERTVGPSLGQDSIERGEKAGLIGGVLVVLSMLIVYKRTALNAIIALILNIILVFAALALFNATLTLPGIAGIVLTVGMAVDANVLIFERIREELRAGRTVKSAVESGFGKAWSSIFDANITTLIAAVFLFTFGTGPIRGFAVTLSVGILASLFTAVFVSRFLFDLTLSRRQRVESLSI